MQLHAVDGVTLRRLATFSGKPKIPKTKGVRVSTARAYRTPCGRAIQFVSRVVNAALNLRIWKSKRVIRYA